MDTVTAFAVLLILAGLAGIGFGVFAMLRGGKEDPKYGGGLGPIPERGIHVLAGIRILVVGVLCMIAGLYALFAVA